MMAPVRVVTAAEVDGWRSTLADAMEAAEKALQTALRPNLAAAGVAWSDPASKNPAGAWDQDAWADVVSRIVEPAALAVADEIIGAITGRVSNRVGSHLAGERARLASLVTARALQGGPSLGRAVGLTADGAIASLVAAGRERYGGIAHPDAQPTVLDAYQDRFDALNKLASNVAGTMSNAATQILAEGAASESSVSYIWNAVGDDKTRDEHDAADGQPQAAGSPFDVGGEELMYPGDPNGSDWNTINCRCWLELEGVDLSRDFDTSLALDVEDEGGDAG